MWGSRQQTLFFFSSLAFIGSWGEDEVMTHELEKWLLANHSAEHLEIQTDTSSHFKELLRSCDLCSKFEIF